MGKKDSKPLQQSSNDPKQGLGSKKPYVKPTLIALGAVTEVTLGGSPTGAESGSGNTRRVQGGGIPLGG